MARTVYSCPMHPEVQEAHPGRCSLCGMDLIREAREEQDQPDKHAGHSTNIFKRKFFVSLILSVPVVLYSDLVQDLLNWQAPQFPGSAFLPLFLSSVIFFYGGWIFLTSAYRELKARMPGMMTLIALAIVVAYGYSVGVQVTGTGRDLFWELSTLITVMLLGHWLEMRSVQGAQSALRELAHLLPDTAEVIHDGTPREVPLDQVREGDLVQVRPGSRIPVDGSVVEGASEVDESMITGESRPVPKKEQDEVIAGTINGQGSLQVKVTKIGEETFLSGVMRLVREAEASKSRLQVLSDRAAYYLTIGAVTIGALTFVAWLAAADVASAIERSVAVLVIACPHALGLAIPLVASISTTKASRQGFLVKRRLALESARSIDTVLFDKTGTLTKGEFGVTEVLAAPGFSEHEVLQTASSVNAVSEHPIAKALVAGARSQGIQVVQPEQFENLPGRGAKAVVQGKQALVGGPALLQEMEIQNPLKEQTQRFAFEGKTVVFAIKEQQVLGVIALADLIREESREAVRILNDMGVKPAMITGDSEDVARWVAKELGIEEYFAGVLPENKAAKVKELQERGLKVAMVGDGVNDAPALASADLGIAIGAGTNVAIESAGIILVQNDPRDVAKIIRLSRLTYAKMFQNLFWATGYNVVAIPLAAGVLAFQGIVLQPALAALFMSLSTVIVAFNAMLLRGQSLER